MGNRYIYSNGKLKTWLQGKCEVCHRFLSKRQEKFCGKHAIEMYRINSLVEVETPIRYYSFQTLREMIKFSLPRYLVDELVEYV